MIHQPKISIVTPSFNQGEFIEQTILSVIKQDYKNYELIIIDGGSTDNTVAVIKKYEHAIAYWISEPDKGQAHAINKGLQVATGEIFNWINSDDYLEAGALKAIALFFEKKPAYNILCGYTRCFWNDSNAAWREYGTGLKSTVTDTVVNVEMSQPGTFYKTAIVRDFAGINESLRYVFDDELWFRYLCKYGLSGVGIIQKRLAHFRLHEASKSVAEGIDLFNKELQSIYIDIAENSNAIDWLIKYMRKVDFSEKYLSRGKWDTAYLDAKKYNAFFATKYINTLYISGEKKLASQALQMSIENGYFKWNRIMSGLRLKLLFH